MLDGTILRAAENAPPHGRRARIAPRLLVLLPLAVPLVVLAVMGWRRRWMSDDGFINLRVVENVFAGHGPVFNVGERVEVGTSTLWMGVLVLGHLVTPFAEPSVVAVYAGLAAAVAGLAFATWASVIVARMRGMTGVALPLGAVVVAALPPFWDFATSGLETGLIFLWLGASYLLLVRRWAAFPVGTPTADRGAGRPPIWPAVVIGLGPLVRPDLGLIAAALGLALLVQSRRSLRSWLGTAVAAAALPVAYEIFRAGYYGTLVPNTALAKGAGSALWHNGVRYLADYAGTYALVVPALLLAVFAWLPSVARAVRARDLPTTALVAAPVIGAAVHALYVVRLGGDFMHARFLLPATFAACMPVATAVVGRTVRARAAVLLPVAGVAVWAVLAGVTMRPDYAGAIGPNGIADERGIYVAQAVSPNPVRLEDYATQGWYTLGQALDQQAADGQRAYVDAPDTRPVADGHLVVVRWPNIGILGNSAGPSVLIADSLSLSDAVGARLDLPAPENPRAGHSHVVPAVWQEARYAAPSPSDDAVLRDAREALGCGKLAELQTAVTAPMTPSRFFSNLLAAPGLTTLNIPGDPEEAVQTFCG
jgi:arabinofuranosyltransferase